ncbi:CDP-diacylglycerol--inositol 3-phosphatidyltransferase-like isoform X2 [Pomacea canaliculata]|uniref:CDP-diacylglycerol--inositol 3-phosphatidyltransferase-like isoform X2 n=1 Tax=Pomacea canaliculata TaxID=400727 RepID=UPI000D73966C|nr:CDP-diacylglycerol--inositol 3-phosphatidyltransferase-like isoform X2 [Pomacea canaliculata]
MSLASAFYLLSGFLDAFDGHFARMLDQGTKLGAMLDMLIDRITTMCLCAALCQFYPRYMLFFQFAMALDIFSHWLHLHSSMMKGSDSHKKIDLSANPILRHYYHNKTILFTMCAANELFFCMLYLVHFTPGPVVPLGPLSVGIFTLILYISAPISLAKNSISVIQLIAAAENMATIDREERVKKAAEQAKQK